MKRDWMDIAPLMWVVLAIALPALFLVWPYLFLRETLDRRRIFKLTPGLHYRVRSATRGEGGVFTVSVGEDALPITLDVDDVATVRWTSFVRRMGGKGDEEWALEITRRDGSRVVLIGAWDAERLVLAELVEELGTRGLVTEPHHRFVDNSGCLNIFMGSLWIIALVWLGTWIWGKL